jgi:hypothetical protein
MSTRRQGHFSTSRGKVLERTDLARKEFVRLHTVSQNTVITATPSKDARGLVASGLQCHTMVFSTSNVLNPDIFRQRNHLGRSTVAVQNFIGRVAKGTLTRKLAAVGKTNLTSRNEVLSRFTVS